jgi:hypothetical protein
MTQEVLKLAFEALDNLLYWDNGKPEYDEAREAITAIKEALAQTELCKYGQEPKSCTSSPMDCQCAIDAALAQQEQDHIPDARKMVTEQEPVAWMRQDGQRVTIASDRHNYPDYETRYSIPLYTAPPQRKPLTQDGTMEIANQTAGQYWMDEAHIQRFRAAVEAAHNIKENT